MNLYGENGGVNGFNTGNCQGVSLWAPSLEALLRKNGTTSNGITWDFKSYNYEEDDTQECDDPRPLPSPRRPIGPTSGPNDNLPSPTSGPPLPDAPSPINIIFGSVLTEAEHNVLLRFWKGLVENETVIQNWVGMFGTTWSNNTEAEWNITDRPEGSTALAIIWPNRDPVTIDIYGSEIISAANENNIPPDDLLMQVQLEEHIHSIQNKQLNDNENRKWNLSDSYAFELEAKLFIETRFWPTIFGKAPPLTMTRVDEHPADFDANRKRFNELHPRKDSLNTDEQEKYDDLIEYFTDLKEKIRKNLVYNTNYNKKDKGGESEED